MSFRARLNRLCTIERNTPGARNAVGGRVEAWANIATSVPYRRSGYGGNENERELAVAIGTDMLFLAYSASWSLKEKDRVSDSVSGVKYDVERVDIVDGARSPHHLEVTVREVRVG